MITDQTKFVDLIDLGADSVGDIQLHEWLEYVRHTCLNVLKDKVSSDELGLTEGFTEAVVALAQAIDSIKNAQE